MPIPIGHNDVYNQYYQTAAYPGVSMNPSFADEMRMRRVTAPAASFQFQSNQGLLGLPGGNAGDLMQQLSSNGGTPFDEGQLDPMLLAYDGGSASDIDPVALQHHSFRNGHANMVDEKFEQHGLENLLDLGNPRDEYHSGSWQSDPNMASLEEESEFDQWMRDHSAVSSQFMYIHVDTSTFTLDCEFVRFVDTHGHLVTLGGCLISFVAGCSQRSMKGVGWIKSSTACIAFLALNVVVYVDFHLF